MFSSYGRNFLILHESAKLDVSPIPWKHRRNFQNFRRREPEHRQNFHNPFWHNTSLSTLSPHEISARPAKGQHHSTESRVKLVNTELTSDHETKTRCVVYWCYRPKSLKNVWVLCTHADLFIFIYWSLTIRVGIHFVSPWYDPSRLTGRTTSSIYVSTVSRTGSPQGFSQVQISH